MGLIVGWPVDSESGEMRWVGGMVLTPTPIIIFILQCPQRLTQS